MILIVLKLTEDVNIYYCVFIFALRNKGCIEKTEKQNCKKHHLKFQLRGTQQF